MRLPLPSGLTQRPLTPPDARGVAAVIGAQEIHDIGEATIDAADVAAAWGRPSFDVRASTIGVFDDDLLVAYAEITTRERGHAAVDPEYRDRGLGTALATWLEATARSRGMTVVQMQVPDGSPGDRLLASLGFEVPWTAWDLAVSADDRPEPTVPPPGHVVRIATESDRRSCWQVLEDALLEQEDRARIQYEDWCAGVIERAGFAPWNLRVAVDASDAVVGVATVVPFGDDGWVERLAVRRDRRGRGLGSALLADAFAAAAQHGATTLKLSTDSRSGALGLYQRAGMQVTSTWNNRRKQLR